MNSSCQDCLALGKIKECSKHKGLLSKKTENDFFFFKSLENSAHKSLFAINILKVSRGIKNIYVGSSLVVLRLGLGAFSGVAGIQSLVWELRSPIKLLRATAKNKQANK